MRKFTASPSYWVTAAQRHGHLFFIFGNLQLEPSCKETQLCPVPSPSFYTEGRGLDCLEVRLGPQILRTTASVTATIIGPKINGINEVLEDPVWFSKTVVGRRMIKGTGMRGIAAGCRGKLKLASHEMFIVW